MITVFVPDWLTTGRHQGALVGSRVSDSDDSDTVLVATSVEPRLPRPSHIGYMINSVGQGDCQLSHTAFPQLTHCVLLTNCRSPRLLGCSVRGRRVPPCQVTLVVYSHRDLCDAPLLRARIGAASTTPDSDPLSALVRHVCRDMHQCARQDQPSSARSTRAAGSVRVGWLRWLLLEVCAVLMTRTDDAAMQARPSSTCLSVSRPRWLLIELVSWLPVRLLSAVSRWMHVLLQQSSVVAQLRCRAAMLAHLVRGERDVRWLNCACMLACDCLLAACLLCLLPVASAEHAGQAGRQLVSLVTDTASSLAVWLATAQPLGVKLHVPLAGMMGGGSGWLLKSSGAVLLHVVPTVLATASSVVSVVAVLGGGASLLLCVVTDASTVAGAGLLVVHAAASWLLRLHVTQLARLWRLMGGRRRDAVTGRVQRWSYSLEQQFVGTLCFTVLMMLLPTVMVAHVMFVCVRLVLAVWLLTLQRVARACCLVPVLCLLAWLCEWRRVAATLKLHVLHADTGGCCVVQARAAVVSLTDTLHLLAPSAQLVPACRALSVTRLARALCGGRTLYVSSSAQLALSSAFTA